MVAGLYVDDCGPYIGCPGVWPWTEARDARSYNGPFPVVAHPPCARWSMLAPLVECTHGIPRGEDVGCFLAALRAVRQFGGVLEHPAFSAAWREFGLLRPPAGGGWVRAGLDDDGWTCNVSQRHYGHRATKMTWLYAVGVRLPALKWGPGPPPELDMSCGFRRRERVRRSVERMGTFERKLTPIPFRDLLLSMARTAA